MLISSYLKLVLTMLFSPDALLYLTSCQNVIFREIWRYMCKAQGRYFKDLKPCFWTLFWDRHNTITTKLHVYTSICSFVGKDVETPPAMCHAAFVGHEFINSRSCEQSKGEDASPSTQQAERKAGAAWPEVQKGRRVSVVEQGLQRQDMQPLPGFWPLGKPTALRYH